MIGHQFHGEGNAASAFKQVAHLALGDFSILGRNGVAVRIELGAPEKFVEPIEHLVGYGVLQFLRLAMNFRPV